MILHEKINSCHNDLKKPSTAKINKYTPSGYSLFTHCSFDATKKHTWLLKRALYERIFI